jgi:electron transfer flavoprotein alpha subunit
VTLAELGVDPATVGSAGSPTWVAGVEQVDVARRAELIEGDDPAALAARLRERLTALDALDASAGDRPRLAAATSRSGAPIWVVVEASRSGVRPVTFELLAKAAELGATLDAPVEAIVIGQGADHAPALAAGGADRVLVAEAPSLHPYVTEAHAAVLSDLIRARGPRLVLLGSTAIGRDLAPRVAGRLRLGLTGDAIDLELDDQGRTRQMKPAFGGAIVAPILSHTRPEMATVRPGMLRAAEPDPSRAAVVERIAVHPHAARVRVIASTPLDGPAAEGLDSAWLVLGVGKGLGRDGVLVVQALAERLGAGLAATREVTDAGWLPRQHQVGLTGRAIAPRLYVGLAIAGAMEHMVGLRGAGTIVAVNKSPKAPILKGADLSLVTDAHALLPHLEAVLRP